MSWNETEVKKQNYSVKFGRKRGCSACKASVPRSSGPIPGQSFPSGVFVAMSHDPKPRFPMRSSTDTWLIDLRDVGYGLDCTRKPQIYPSRLLPKVSQSTVLAVCLTSHSHLDYNNTSERTRYADISACHEAWIGSTGGVQIKSAAGT